MIPALGAGGPGFKSRLSPYIFFLVVSPFIPPGTFYALRTTHLSITFQKTSAKNHLFSCEKFEVIWERRPETAKTSVVKKSSKVLRSYGSVHKQCRSNCRLYLESVSEKMYFGNLLYIYSNCKRIDIFKASLFKIVGNEAVTDSICL